MDTQAAEFIKKNPFLAFAIIIVISVAVYSNTIHGEFVWDDKGLIVSNTSIRSIQNIPRFFVTDSWKITGQPSGPYYRPVINTLWTLEYQLWGINPKGYHVANILFHSLLSLLLFFFFKKITDSGTVSLVASLIFAAHPVHVENVAWITGVGYLACAIFIIVSFLFYIRFTERSSSVDIMVSMLFFTLAVFSIEYALLFPVILFLYEFLVKDRFIRIKILRPYLLVILVYLIIRGSLVAAQSDPTIPLYSRFLTSFVIVSQYLYAFFLPLTLNVLYDIRPINVFVQKEVIVSLGVMIGIVILMFYLYRKDKKALFALLWFFIFLVPVLNIIVVVKPQMMSLRYLFIPSIGLSLFTAMYVNKIFPRLKIIPILILILLSVKTVTQNRYWQNEILLYGKMVTDAPTSAIARNNLAVAYLEAGMPLKALPEFEKAVLLDPTYGFALFNLGNTYQTLNVFDKAYYYLHKAIATNPRDSRAYNSLGVLYKKMGRYQESVYEFERALTSNPQNYEAHYNLATLLFSIGKDKDALPHFIAFIRLAPAKYNPMKLSIQQMLGEKGLTVY